MFEFIQVHVDCKHGWHGFDRTPKKTVFLNQLDVPRTSQNHNVSLSPERILSGHSFQNFDFWAAQYFSQIFSPLRSVGFCPAASASGSRLPRLDTAALGSRQRLRRRGGAAPGGRGGRGCTEQRQPWPRRRIWGGKTSWGMGFRCEGNVKWRCWWFKLFGIYCFQFLWRVSAKIHLRQCLVLFKKHGEVNEDVDGSSEWNVDGLSVWLIYCFTFFWKFAKTFAQICFLSSRLCFLHPSVYI